MLARLTSKNRITLPKVITTSVEATDYFDVTVDDGRIILTPVRIQRTLAVREKLERLGITEKDVEDASVWARRI